MKKFMALLLAAITAMTLFVGCAQQKETFTVGLDDQFPPMGFRDEDNNIVGFDIDLATEVAKRLGKEIVLQPVDWDSKEMELETGNIDVIWNGLTITDERKEELLMSRAYMKNNQVILVAEGSDIAAKADLAGKKVGVQTGSSGEEALEADEIRSEVADVVGFADFVTAMTDLRAGAVDAVVIDEIVAEYTMTQQPDVYKIVGESLQAEEYGIAFKKGNTELLDEVMKAFDEMLADGTAAEISNKWFSKDILISY